ncbi:MAG: trypsin-like peptidase domain-containing protein [Deltaproteobacteria bacterium]|jgi:S1-C subfamily serine protease|nr:trypsin-like peptidase domain-containing protein [Deltaproteobacteria bacterium]
MGGSDSLGALKQSVVKVMTVSDSPDYEQPWQTLGAAPSTGSGAIIETPQGLHVLTNAHVVEDATFIEVRREGHERSVVAEVVGYGETCDLALLCVEEQDFFEGAKPIPIGELPALGDSVNVLGFPIGGEQLSVTEGVVSRIELTLYVQNERNLLSLQIDAAINAGNSGGPVTANGKLVGVAFQALEEAENIGYVICAPVVEHFLRDVESPPYNGFPDLGITVQDLESSAHRKYLGLPRTRRGILVNQVHHGGSCANVLEPGDVLLKVDGHSIATDGSVQIDGGVRIGFPYAASMRYVGEEIPLEIYRDGERSTQRVTLQRYRPLVPGRPRSGRPSWFVYAGLLFVPLTRAWLETWGEAWRSRAPATLVSLYDHGIRTSQRQEVVILQKVLADKSNRGYHDVESVQIAKAQGKRVRRLTDLVRILDATEGEFVVLETANALRIVLDRKLAVERAEAILRRYGVPADRSPDLQLQSRR